MFIYHKTPRKPRHLTDNIPFTLIELLVVISIIAILMSIFLPALNKAKNTGKRIVCVGNTRQIYLAVITYTGDNNAYAPCFLSLGHAVSTGTDWGGSLTPSQRCTAPRPAILTYGTNNWYYPMGFLVDNKYVVADGLRCPLRKLEITSGGNNYFFDAKRYWLKQVNGLNQSVMSSYSIKILRWEDWLAHSGDSGSYGYRPGSKPGTENRVLISEYPSYTGTGLSNPYDIYTHTQPYGITVAREDGETKHVISSSSMPFHSSGSSDLFNGVFYYLRRSGEYTNE